MTDLEPTTLQKLDWNQTKLSQKHNLFAALNVML